MQQLTEIDDLASSLPPILRLEMYMCMLQEIGGSIENCARSANNTWLDSAFAEQCRYENEAKKIRKKITAMFLDLQKPIIDDSA